MRVRVAQCRREQPRRNPTKGLCVLAQRANICQLVRNTMYRRESGCLLRYSVDGHIGDFDPVLVLDEVNAVHPLGNKNVCTEFLRRSNVQILVGMMQLTLQWTKGVIHEVHRIHPLGTKPFINVFCQKYFIEKKTLSNIRSNFF